MKRKPAIALVLGSGAARGLVHIGIIDWLVAHGVTIHSIAGSSMGAVVGGMYAAGRLDDYRRWVCALDEIDVVRLLDLSFSTLGLVKGDRIIGSLRQLVGDCRIEDLPVRYTAVAVDVDRGDEIWLSEGSLFDAMRASFAIPTVFTPHQYRGRTLFDGGLLNPLPIAPTFDDHVDYRVAVNLNGKPDPRWDQPLPPATSDDEPSAYRRRIKSFIAGLGYTDPNKGAERNLLDVALAAFDTMQGSIARMKEAAYPPDFTIEIPRNRCRAHEFYRATELIEYGRQVAEEALGRVFPA